VVCSAYDSIVENEVSRLFTTVFHDSVQVIQDQKSVSCPSDDGRAEVGNSLVDPETLLTDENHYDSSPTESSDSSASIIRLPPAATYLTVHDEHRSVYTVMMKKPDDEQDVSLLNFSFGPEIVPSRVNAADENHSMTSFLSIQ
jgi:hypothetical protein